MLVRLYFENLFSFKESHDFSMLASSKSERLMDDTQNSFKISDKERVLASAVVFGPNASGKTNFVNVFSYLKLFVSTGNRNLEENDFLSPCFLLDAVHQHKPMVFEVVARWNKRTYRYGFSLTKGGIQEEWFFVKDKRETEVFSRKKQRFNIPAKYEILKQLTDKGMVHTKAFLVTVGAQFNDESCAGFLNWINNLGVISGIQDNVQRSFTISKMKESRGFSKRVVELIKYADLGIEDVRVNSKSGRAFKMVFGEAAVVEEGEATIDDLVSKRYFINEKGERELREFNFGVFESEGTQKFTNIAGPILDVLDNGGVLVIDELDVKLHPDLTERLVLMFHNKKVNPKHAQLIFTSHNTNLLNSRIFRRDQIFFVEKDAFGASDIYSLANIKNNGKGVRNDEDIQLNYSKGKYGAVPFLGDFDNFLGR